MLVVAVLSLIGLTAAGRVIVGWTMGGERPGVTWPMSVALGLVAWTVAAALLGLVLPFPAAVGTALGALGLVGAYGLLRLATQSGWVLKRPRLPRIDVTLTLVLALAALGTYVNWHAAVWGGTSEENLFWHSAIASTLARGDYPPDHPLEPDFPLLYRLGFHMLAAGVQIVSGVHIAAAMAFAVVLSVTLATWLVHTLALRCGVAPWGAKLMAAAFLLASPANWLVLPLTAQQLGAEFVRGERYLRAVAQVETSVVNGIGVLQQVEANVSLAAGYMPALAALALLAPGGRRPRGAEAAGVCTAAVLLASALATNEALFGVFAAGMGLTALLSVRRERHDALRVLGALGASIPLGILAGSILTTSLVAGYTPPTGLRLDLARLGHFPGIGWLDSTARSSFYPSGTDLMFPAVWNPAVVGELWWLAAALAAGAVMALRGDWLARGLTLTAATGLIVPQVVTVSTFPWDGFRFLAAIVPLAGILAAYFGVFAWTWPGSARHRRILGLGALVVVVAASGSTATGALRWPADLARLEHPSLEAEIAATQSLWNLRAGRRVLVVPGAVTREGLYSHRFPVATTRYVLGLGGQSVPMGFDHYSQPEFYRSDYRAASDQLNDEALRRLRIDLIYVSPAHLSIEQSQAIKQLVNNGKISRVLSAGHETEDRVIYAVAPAEAQP